MKRSSYGVSLALTVSALLGLAHPGPAVAQQKTVLDVRGTLLHSEPVGAAAFENKLGGDLAGDLFGIIYEARQPEADGTLRLFVSHVFRTPEGNLYALAAPVLTPIATTPSQTDYDFTEPNIILGGTGKYKGATGEIQLRGTFDLSTGTGAWSYSGKIHLP